MRRRQITPYRLVTAGLLTLLTLIVVGNSWGVFQTDIKPEVYLAPGEMLPRYLSAWSSSPYLGSPNLNVGLVPVLAVTALLRGIGLDAEMAFKIYHLLLWALAAWGTARLLRTLVPRAGRWAALIAGVAYIANPYAVAAGGTLAIALPMALLPIGWELLWVHHLLRHRWLRTRETRSDLAGFHMFTAFVVIVVGGIVLLAYYADAATIVRQIRALARTLARVPASA